MSDLVLAPSMDEEHKQLLDLIVSYEDREGVCRVTYADLAKRIGCRQPEIGKMISEINEERTYIEKVSPGQYKVHL